MVHKCIFNWRQSLPFTLMIELHTSCLCCSITNSLRQCQIKCSHKDACSDSLQPSLWCRDGWRTVHSGFTCRIPAALCVEHESLFTEPLETAPKYCCARGNINTTCQFPLLAFSTFTFLDSVQVERSKKSSGEVVTLPSDCLSPTGQSVVAQVLALRVFGCGVSPLC